MGLNTSSDNVVELLRARNERGLRLLFDQYSASIMGLLERMIKDRQIAEEVLQTSFLKAWERIDRFDESKASLHTWLYAIARNSALDVIRLKSFERRSRSHSLDESDLNEKPVYLHTAGIDTHELMSRIEEKYRQVLDCLYLQGYSQRETAEKLNIPLGTVKSRLRAGMNSLREQIGPEEELFLMAVTSIIILITWILGS